MTLANDRLDAGKSSAQSAIKTTNNDSRLAPLSRPKTFAQSVPSKTGASTTAEQAASTMTTIAKPVVPVRKNKQREMLKQQIKLVKNKEIRAVPDGYYTGLINDMHNDYANFTRKRTFLQMEYLTPLLQDTKQTTQLIDRFNEETRLEERKIEKSKAPLALNALAIQCSLPAKYDELENLSPISFLVNYAKPLLNRQQVAQKSIRKIQREAILDVSDAKDVVFDYFNQYKTYQEIDDLFNFLEIKSTTRTFEPTEVVIICCYAERYFLHKLAETKIITFERAQQEIVDFEFLMRKFNTLKLNDDLRRLIFTLQQPDQEHLKTPTDLSRK